MIRWTSEFIIGIPEIDLEHQFLFEALNDFYNGLRSNEPTKSITKLIDKLVYYARMHFSHEEELMRMSGFPQLHEHMLEHMEFLEIINRYHDNIQKNKPVASLEITAFIKDWINNHILIEDKKIKPYYDSSLVKNFSNIFNSDNQSVTT